jgi:hypothetical protein
MINKIIKERQHCSAVENHRRHRSQANISKTSKNPGSELSTNTIFILVHVGSYYYNKLIETLAESVPGTNNGV